MRCEGTGMRRIGWGGRNSWMSWIHGWVNDDVHSAYETLSDDDDDDDGIWVEIPPHTYWFLLQ